MSTGGFSLGTNLCPPVPGLRWLLGLLLRLQASRCPALYLPGLAPVNYCDADPETETWKVRTGGKEGVVRGRLLGGERGTQGQTRVSGSLPAPSPWVANSGPRSRRIPISVFPYPLSLALGSSCFLSVRSTPSQLLLLLSLFSVGSFHSVWYSLCPHSQFLLPSSFSSRIRPSPRSRPLLLSWSVIFLLLLGCFLQWKSFFLKELYSFFIQWQRGGPKG